MAYALAHLLGDYLVPMTHPDHQKPAYILSMPLSYPQVIRGLYIRLGRGGHWFKLPSMSLFLSLNLQFVEVVGACLVLKVSTEHELGLYRDVKTVSEDL